ncbi:MAG: hypothetical protein WC175_05105 [Candidatus Dojkabacteria bacterium]
MVYNVPIGGVSASIFYDFEDAFGVYDNPYINPKYYLNINKLLGQGIRVTSWKDSNNVEMTYGTNSIEATTSYDGQYSGDMDISFQMTGDISWIESVMGAKTEEDGIITYSPSYTPKSMTFVIFLKNRYNSDTSGDVFVLKGVVINRVRINIKKGTSPAMVELNIYYADVRSFDADDIPYREPSQENVFNFGEAIAYFWSPSVDPRNPSSFDSTDVIIEDITLDISHGPEMLAGISSRKARERFYKNLTYETTINAVYINKDKFLEKTYGCKGGPVTGTVKPFEKIRVVFQNAYTCGDSYRRLEFDYLKNKVNSNVKTLVYDDKIMEEMQILPTKLTINQYNGAVAVPHISVSPYHIKQNELFKISLDHFPAGQDVTLNIDGSLYSSAETINCVGELDYRGIAYPTSFAIGEHTITASVYSGVDEVTAETTIFVTDADGAVPTMIVCPSHFDANTVDDTYEDISIKAYNLSPVSVTTTETLNLYEMDGDLIETHNVHAYTGTEGMMSFSIGTLTTTYIGCVKFELIQIISGGEYVCRDYIYITDITSVDGSGDVRNITVKGLKPNEKAYLYINDAYKGSVLIDDDSNATVSVEVANTTSAIVEFKQDIVSSHGPVRLVASSTITFS